MTYKGNFRVGQTFEFVESIGAIGAMLRSFSLPALLARGGGVSIRMVHWPDGAL